MAERARLPKVTHEGTLKIGDVTILCANLDDNRRVLTQEGFLEAIGRSKKAKGGQGSSVDEMLVFLPAKNLQPLAEAILTRSTKLIKFRRAVGGIAYGYEAELLPEVCKVVLQARAQGILHASQERMAQQCERLVLGLLEVGITALVDEATGYQYERDRYELRKIIDRFVTGDFAKWTKTFPDVYYQHLYRLLDWPWKPGGGRPGYIGTLTNELVYKRLPSGVLDELRRVNPRERSRRKRKHFQHLTEDIGNPHLREHLIALINTMRPARNWKEFERAFRINFGDGLEQLEFDTSLDEAAPSILPPEEDEEDKKK